MGQLESGIYVLQTISGSKTGSGLFVRLMFVAIECDREIDDAGFYEQVDSGGAISLSLRKKRHSIKTLGTVSLGDRWQGKLEVSGNSVIIGKDTGIYAGTEGGGRFSGNGEEKILRMNVEGRVKESGCGDE